MDLFSNNELIIMIVLVIGLFLIVLTLTFLDMRDNMKKEKIKIEKEDKIDEEKIEEISDSSVEISVSDVPKESIAELFEEIELIEDEEEASLEVIPVEATPKDLAIMELQKVKEELINEEKKEVKEDAITTFELEQEENAIISLDELSKISDTIYSNNEIAQYDDGNEPITIDEVINKFKDEKEEVSLPNIYNVVDNNSMEFENTASYTKFDLEKNKDFLSKLKEVYDEEN